MISSTFYNKGNATAVFFKGTVGHFPAKDPSVTITWYEYTLKQTDTLHTLAEKVFGRGMEHLWTYIADNNPLVHPDSWEAGDIIKLPLVIVKDTDTDSTLKKL